MTPAECSDRRRNAPLPAVRLAPGRLQTRAGVGGAGMPALNAPAPGRSPIGAEGLRPAGRRPAMCFGGGLRRGAGPPLSRRARLR